MKVKVTRPKGLASLMWRCTHCNDVAVALVKRGGPGGIAYYVCEMHVPELNCPGCKKSLVDGAVRTANGSRWCSFECRDTHQPLYD
jgi:hypothetical protein